jgi:tetratricopeptide (TPR) repeat protein
MSGRVAKRIVAGIALCSLPVVVGCASVPRSAPRPAQKSFGAVIESQDKRLADTLLKLSLAPSAAQHRAVAAQYRRLGIDDVAFDHLKAALRLEPSDAAAYDELARLWRDWGFPELGLADAARAVYYAPSSAAAHNTRGTLLLATGQTDAARREFEAALRIDPHAWFAVQNLCSLSRYGKETVGDCPAPTAPPERAR